MLLLPPAVMLPLPAHDRPEELSLPVKMLHLPIPCIAQAGAEQRHCTSFAVYSCMHLEVSLVVPSKAALALMEIVQLIAVHDSEQTEAG